MADQYYERGEFAKALENHRKILAAELDDFEAIVQAGNSARHAGDVKAAAGFFAHAAKLRPGSWIPIYNQACLAAVQATRRSPSASSRACEARGSRAST